MGHSSEQSKRAKNETYRKSYNHLQNRRGKQKSKTIKAFLHPLAWQKISDLGPYKRDESVQGCRLRVIVLVIIEQKVIDEVPMMRVLCGDQSGIAQFYIQQSEIVRQGVVLELINVKFTKHKNGSNKCIIANRKKGAVIKLSNQTIARIGRFRLSNKVFELVDEHIYEIETLAVLKGLQLEKLTSQQRKILDQRLNNRIRPGPMFQRYLQNLPPDFKKIHSSFLCDKICTHDRLDTTHQHHDTDMVEFLNKLQGFSERYRDVWRTLCDEISKTTGEPRYQIAEEFQKLKLEERLKHQTEKYNLAPLFNNDTEDLFQFFAKLYNSPIDTVCTVTCKMFFILWKALRIELVTSQPLKLLKKQLKNVAEKMLRPYFEQGLQTIVKEVVEAVIARNREVFGQQGVQNIPNDRASK